MQHYIKGHEFEALKYRHEDQAKLLQHLSSLDFKIYSGFFSIQIALGGFLSQVDIEGNLIKSGLLLIDILISLVCWKLLWDSYRYRKEVGRTIKNCNISLGYEEVGAYAPDIKINSEVIERSRYLGLRWAVIMAPLAIALILFGTT